MDIDEAVDLLRGRYSINKTRKWIKDPLSFTLDEVRQLAKAGYCDRCGEQIQRRNPEAPCLCERCLNELRSVIGGDGDGT